MHQAELAALWDHVREILEKQDLPGTEGADATHAATRRRQRDTPSGPGTRKLSVVIHRAAYLRFKLHCARADLSHQEALSQALTELLDRAGTWGRPFSAAHA